MPEPLDLRTALATGAAILTQPLDPGQVRRLVHQVLSGVARGRGVTCRVPGLR